MGKTMRLLCLLVLAALALAGVANANEQLEKLCRLDEDAPRVVRVAEVKEMIKSLKEGQVACKQKTAEAIKALEPIVELQSVCSEEAADKMVAFWKDFVRTKADGRKHLPKQLRKFFIAYGLQMSKLCKAAMIEQLEKATNANKITNDDIQLVTKRLNNLIGKLFTDERIENLLAIVQAYKHDKSEDSSRVSMEPLQKEIFGRTRARCITKFKPIYDSLITPIVRLAAIGINYRGDSIDGKMKEFYGNQLYKDWFAAVLACEASLTFVPISVPKQIVDATGNKKMITFLDDEDLAELRKKGLAEEEPAIEAPADYALNVSVGDSVIDEGDADLMRSMKNYGGLLKDVNKFRLRMMKKTPYLLKKYVDRKSVQIGFLHPTKRSKAEAKDTLAKFGRGRLDRFTQVFLLCFGLFWAGVAVSTMVLTILATHGLFTVMYVLFASVLFLAMSTLVVAIVRDMVKGN